MEKVITIKTDKSKFFRQYLEILNNIINIRPKELDVLAQFLLKNDELKSIPEEHRGKVLFDYDTKLQISETLKISSAYLDNCICTLRKKGIIVNNKIVKNFLIYPEKVVSIKFTFNIE